MSKMRQNDVRDSYINKSRCYLGHTRIFGKVAKIMLRNVIKNVIIPVKILESLITLLYAILDYITK